AGGRPAGTAASAVPATARRIPLFAQFPPAALFAAIRRAVSRRQPQRQIASGMGLATARMRRTGGGSGVLPNLLSSTTIPALSEVLNFAQARHTVLAGNITNVNTPGYRLRDLSQATFQQKLKEAIAESKQTAAPLSPGLAASQPGDEMH